MSERSWRFLIDENVSPDVVRFLRKEGYRAKFVPDVLSKGAEDIDDIVPYAVEHDFIVVTQDVSDFGRLPDSDHVGVVLLHDQQVPPFEIANALMDVVDAYDRREVFEAEALDDWL